MTLMTSVVIAGFSLSIGVSQAHEGGHAHMANPGYIGDANGHLEQSIDGSCLKTKAWTPELALAACGDAVKQVAAPAPAKAVQAPAAPVVRTQNIDLKAGALFDVNKATLKQGGIRELDQIASQLQNLKKVEKITVVGHTDSAGNDSYNQQLSMRRAESVKKYLMSKGISSDMIKTIGMGEAQPVASNSNAAGRAQNRRVSLEIKGQ